MRARIKFICARVGTNLEQSGTSVRLAYNSWPANTPRDRVTNPFLGTATVQNQQVQAFIHFVTAPSTVRQFNEIEIGDAILDLALSLNLRGLDGVVYLLSTGADGAHEQWENKPISTKLATYWDTIQGGKRLFQTVLLKKAA